MSQLCLTLWRLGYPDRAIEKSHQAINLAQKSSHLFSVAYALTFDGFVHQSRGERQAALDRAEEVIALCTEQGFAFYLAWGTVLRGWALAAQGQSEEGTAQIGEGLNAVRATGAKLGRSYLALLAEAHGHAGQIKQAVETVDEALFFVKQSNEHFYSAELHRIKGELTLEIQSVGPQINIEEEAEACFIRAIELAREQQAKSWELRATKNLACLWHRQNKKAEAHELLANVYNWFTEGFDTRDLQEAKTLLEELE